MLVRASTINRLIAAALAGYGGYLAVREPDRRELAIGFVAAGACFELLAESADQHELLAYVARELAEARADLWRLAGTKKAPCGCAEGRVAPASDDVSPRGSGDASPVVGAAS